MPTYEYKCTACGHAFEQFQSITAAPVKRCPDCGKSKVKRLVSSGAGLIFKGSGFYITDYRDSAYKEKAKADSGSTETKSDAAPAGDSKPADAKSGESKPADQKPAESKPAASAEPTKASKSASKSGRKSKK
jgi:putative FmdB family regulatory protein